MIKQSGLTVLWGFKTLSEAEQAKIILVKNGYFAHIHHESVKVNIRFNNNRFEKPWFWEPNDGPGKYKLTTKSNQCVKAYILLVEHKLVPPKNLNLAPSALENFQKTMSKIPLVKNFNIVYQILFVGLFISLFILGSLWYYGILKF